jgi:hypothetical protein
MNQSNNRLAENLGTLNTIINAGYTILTTVLVASLLFPGFSDSSMKIALSGWVIFTTIRLVTNVPSIPK